ncbi:single-stranded DNA-binding protein [Nocardia cyriacigeorgica]|uniref:Single-stranded DNA-binding protein n=3 Tax=Nocardia TaxID=1817 RepID=H6R954_NOCCG|nr:single-stranded DNA-binding protein [Nocardia cyriacigeorgica]TLF77772.1 single-stranded DNA-binding protein [Nocardia cyriacigeorgica]CCF63629.1 Single-stranded DNA-binding protein (SSB) (Helix-destabilizing protein) [Nocardia cyriacigeorgica GUH-2]
MAADTNLPLIGNLTADPEIRYTPAGVPVANFTVASTPRVFNRAAGEWIDGEALFMRCTAWREMAENVAESLTRGSRVIVFGRLKSHSWTTEDGQRRSRIDLEVDEVGPSLRYATAKVTRTPRPSATTTATTTAAADRSGDLVGAGVGADPWSGNNAGWGAASPGDDSPGL